MVIKAVVRKATAKNQSTNAAEDLKKGKKLKAGGAFHV